MPEIVISVDNLSKRYLIGHRSGSYRYTALRDVIGREVRNFIRKGLDFCRGKQIIQGDDVEELWALKDVSFTVSSGEVIGVIGSNGAGKSTLLKILSRITEPTEGQVRLRGRVGSLLEIGTGFHPELTGRENIFLNGAILGMTQREIRSKFDEIVAFAEVEKFLDTPVKHYSSGMYVRLAFAVAAHLEPEILIVDEVLAVGDVAFQKKCLGKMQDVADSGRTVLFVSHNMSAINTLCQRSVYLENGRVKAIGPTREIVPEYLSSALNLGAGSVDRLRTPGFGEKVRLVNVSLETGNRSTLVFGEPLTYMLGVRADVKTDGVSIGSSIFNGSGACVGSLLLKETFSIDRDEEVTLRLVIRNLNLVPGVYYAGVSVVQGGRIFDLVIGAPVFHVIPNGNMIIENWHSNWGSIAISECTLQVEKRLGAEGPGFKTAEPIPSITIEAPGNGRS
jgi:lipopolysaccharide transport system ATP-binding protein